MGYLIPEEAQWPTTQGFGQFPGGVNPAGGHTGWDKGTPVGRPLRAPSDGIVMYEGFPGTVDGSDNPWLLVRGGGLCCVIDSADGLFTWTMGHLSQTLVSKGERVTKGQIVAYSGASGYVTGPHHHFGVLPDKWNVHNGTYGYINPAHVTKEYHVEKPPAPWNGRYTRGVVNQRSAPRIEPDNIVRVIPAQQLEIWEGYVHGQEVTVDGVTTDIWFQDKLGYAWAGAFEGEGVGSLPDLTPREKPLQANERKVLPEGANQRKEPKTGDTEIVRFVPGNTIEIFTGYVHGEWVDRTDGFRSDIWYVDAKGYIWCGAFTDTSTTGLPDLTVIKPPPDPRPEPIVDFPHLNGIDVSVYQEKASLNLIESDFYFIKASEGGGGWDDDALASNVAEARLSGKVVGFYHFARPMLSEGNTAAEEARSFLSVITPYLRAGDLVALDWEAENQHLTDWALEWLQIVRDTTGAIPFIYMNSQAVNSHDWTHVEREFPLWLAFYGTNPVIDRFLPRPVEDARTTWEAGLKIWQYGSRARLHGYDGDLDVNTFYGTIEELKELGALHSLQEEPENPVDPVTPPPPVVDPAEPTEEQVAEIIAEYHAWLKEKFLEDRRGQ